jgi:hypothetical protein
MHSGHAPQWREDEDDELIAWYGAGERSEDEIARRLGRHSDDIWVRLWELLVLPAFRSPGQVDDQ